MNYFEDPDEYQDEMMAVRREAREISDAEEVV
jgi:hypothetical protein